MVMGMNTIGLGANLGELGYYVLYIALCSYICLHSSSIPGSVPRRLGLPGAGLHLRAAARCGHGARLHLRLQHLGGDIDCAGGVRGQILLPRGAGVRRAARPS